MPLRVEQDFNIDTNWNDGYDDNPKKAEMRKEASRVKAEHIAELLRDPEKGIHAEAYESVCGWAVEVVHNTITHGEAMAKEAK